MSSWLQLGNRIAIVTGAGSGIGKSISKALFQQGCHVILADIDDSKIEDTAHELITNYSTSSQNDSMERYPSQNETVEPILRTFSCDVTISTQVEQLINFADNVKNDMEQRNKLKHEMIRSKSYDQDVIPNAASILVNCAGITKDGFMFKMNEGTCYRMIFFQKYFFIRYSTSLF